MCRVFCVLLQVFDTDVASASLLETQYEVHLLKKISKCLSDIEVFFVGEMYGLRVDICYCQLERYYSFYMYTLPIYSELLVSLKNMHYYLYESAW
jgi:hypothetical protein